MKFEINQNVFKKTFLNTNGEGFSHKTNRRFNLFPFTGSTSDKPVYSFDNILGVFLCSVYEVDPPKTIDRDKIIEKICEEINFGEHTVNKSVFREMLKVLYFEDDHTLKKTAIETYKYSPSDKNENKIAEYIVDAICDRNLICDAIEKSTHEVKNVCDTLLEKHLPKLHNTSSKNVKYITMLPQIKDLFNNDLLFLLQDHNTEANDLIQLIEYYYFFYTSQVIFKLNNFFEEDKLVPLFFCLDSEKTSKSRSCYTKGWKRLHSKLNTMFSHAVLLEMLNQNNLDEKYSYQDIKRIISDVSPEELSEIFSQIEKMKSDYMHKYAPEDEFTYDTEISYYADDVEKQIHSFFNAIMLQFDKTSRSRANEAYSKSFSEFCRTNFLKNRKANGLMLMLTEEQLVFLTKLAIGTNQQLRLNTLFSEFEKRGIYMDTATKECVVEYYEKLNIIEKKSDSGDAQYVKGIL